MKWFYIRHAKMIQCMYFAKGTYHITKKNRISISIDSAKSFNKTQHPFMIVTEKQDLEEIHINVKSTKWWHFDFVHRG